MDVRSALKLGISQLREAGVPSFTLAAELLLLQAIARDRAWLYAHPEEPFSASDCERFFELIKRRAAGEPTQHLTGKQEFWGLEFAVTPDVLIPRPETEHIIEVALDRLALRELRNGRKQVVSGEGLSVADIGTGSGCIAIALAKELPAARFYATDISAAALAVAQHNAGRYSVSDQIRFLESNLFEAFSQERAQPAAALQRGTPKVDGEPQKPRQQLPLFDLIVSNPPYIGRRETQTLMREVRDHEPEIALYGGEEGYEFYAGLIAQSAAYLKPGGLLVLELGHDSLPAVQPLLDAPTWGNVGLTNDLAGIPRVIAAEKL